MVKSNDKLQPGQEILFRVTNHSHLTSGWGGATPYWLDVAVMKGGQPVEIFGGGYNGERELIRAMRNFLFTINQRGNSWSENGVNFDARR